MPKSIQSFLNVALFCQYIAVGWILASSHRQCRATERALAADVGFDFSIAETRSHPTALTCAMRSSSLFEMPMS